MNSQNSKATNDWRAAVEASYKRGAHEYASAWSAPHPWLDPARQEVFRRCDRGVLLDVGCGPGQDSEYWNSKGFDVVGIDISPDMLQIARSRCPECTFKRVDALEAKSLDQTFDVVWACFSLLHLPLSQLPKAVRSLCAVLRPGGVFFLAMAIADESHEDLAAPIAGLTERGGSQVSAHMSRWTVDGLRDVLRPLLTDEWSEVSAPVNGRSAYFGVWQRASHPTTLVQKAKR